MNLCPNNVQRPIYVKPFVKRQKNDAADAEAICEAAQRPSMRFVPVKTEAQQAAALVFRARDLLVKQRTQISNAVRGHMTEHGWIAPQGLAHMKKLAALLEDPSAVPESARPVLEIMLDQMAVLSERIAELMLEKKNLNANVDFYSATVYYSLGIPTDLFTPIFAIARTAGWTAHILEHLDGNRLIRPRAQYAGDEGKPWVALGER